jgi:rod shape-determining protein MreD
MSPVDLMEDSFSPTMPSRMPRAPLEPRLEVHRFRAGAVVGTAFLALLLQAFLPVYMRSASLLELPLLVTLYFGLSRRNPSRGLLLGMVIGMAQDGLSGTYVGLFGIALTLVGYLASTIGGRLDVEHPYSRLFLAFFASHFQHVVHALTRRWLLDEREALFSLTLLLASVINAVLAVGLFALLDRLRDTDA